MAPRDFQRQKVYDLDVAVGGRFETPISLPECEALIIEAHRYYGLRWIGSLKDGRGTRRAYGNMYSISLPTWSRTPSTVLHEAAHAIIHKLFFADWGTKLVMHGPEFTRVLLELWAHAGLATLDRLIITAGMAGIYVSANERCLPPEKRSQPIC